MNLQRSMKLRINQSRESTTAWAEVASNGGQGTNSPHTASNDCKGSSSRDKQSVVLLSWTLKEALKRYIGKQKVYHHRAVVEGEKVVWVEEVLDPHESIFEAPQNGMHTLSGLVSGGFVIWPIYS